MEEEVDFDFNKSYNDFSVEDDKEDDNFENEKGDSFEKVDVFEENVKLDQEIKKLAGGVNKIFGNTANFKKVKDTNKKIILNDTADVINFNNNKKF